MLFGGNLVDKELDRTVAAASRFYTIAYSPRDGTNANAAFHKIAVELQRPGLTVYARKGYYGIPSGARFGTVARMERVLANPLPYTGLAVTDTSLNVAASTGKSGAVAHIQLALHSNQLTWHDQADGSRRCTLDIASAEVPTSGALVAYSVKQSIISMQASERPSAGATVTVSVLQPLVNPTGYLRVAVRDQESGKIGTAEIRSLPVATSSIHP